ncbi:MAG: hypothetical protein WC533_04355 [Candidatus Pacearchaeota archaeon]
MSKKENNILFYGLIIILTIFTIQLVSAQYYGNSALSYIDLGQGMRDLIDQVVRITTPIFEVLLGDYDSGSELFFTKVMFLILIFIVIMAIMQKVAIFEGNRGATFVISSVISIIATRFLTDNQLIQGILLPYGALGIAITTIFPFLIFGYFIYHTEMSGMGRKLSWTFFGVTFIVLWLYKSSEIGALGNQIYFWTILAIGVLIIFDKHVNAYFRGEDVKKWMESSKDREIADLQVEWAKYEPIDSPQAERQRKRIQKRMRRLGGGLHK